LENDKKKSEERAPPCGKACRFCWSKKLHDMRHKLYLQGRLQNCPQYKYPFEKIQLFSERLDEIKTWRKPKVVFVCSGSDLFHPLVPDDFIIDIFLQMIDRNSQHTYLLLTKQIKRATTFIKKMIGFRTDMCLNIYFGISIWNQESANRDIPILLNCWKGKTWISAEPLLGNVDLEFPYGQGVGELAIERLNQVVVGAESGSNRRYCFENWIRNIARQCDTAGVPCYVKQIARSDGKVITDPKLFPDDLQKYRQLAWRK
jgi:protein gp37